MWSATRFASLAFLLLAIITGESAFIGLAAGTAALRELAAALQRRLGTQLRASARLWPRAVFMDECLDIELMLQNESDVPVPSAELQLDVPDALQAADALAMHPHHLPGRHMVRHGARVRAHEALKVSRRFRATHRGRYTLGPAHLAVVPLIGEAFQLRAEKPVHLTVYPRLVPVSAPALAALRPLPQVDATSLAEDELRFRGLRPYVAGDPLRRLHVLTSQRLGKPMIRLFDTAAEPTVVLFLNLSGSSRVWEGAAPGLLERAISLAASLAVSFAEDGCAVGLYANGALGENAGRRAVRARLNPSRSPDHLRTLLTYLGDIVPAGLFSHIGLIMEQEARLLPSGSECFALSAFVDDAILAGLLALQRHGHRVRLLTPRAALVQAGPFAALAWEDVADG